MSDEMNGWYKLPSREQARSHQSMISRDRDRFDDDLARALKALEEAEGDIDAVLRDHPNAEALRPYLELSDELLAGLLDGANATDNSAARAELIARVKNARDARNQRDEGNEGRET